MSISIINDKLNEDDEKFKVVLSVVNAPAVKGIIPGVAVVTIIDDDGKFVLFDMCRNNTCINFAIFPQNHPRQRLLLPR